ncbi:hypothetical protein CLOLEP_00354 [[Clostridium] leptum DSM 753]|uniref:Uncharacterized protein n=1 Tax=[Clostridium] leptum DSM 753 TaxID=428125 RepID=A7VP78_9FIRM|nr:hypothetical protein CLOLEP_00354 [[Clostridium] leptum DSM 753]
MECFFAKPGSFDMRKARPEISGPAFIGLLFQKRILMAHWKS